MKKTHVIRDACIAAAACLPATSALAATYTIQIDGSDAVWLAGRTDLVIPAANLPWPGGLIRHEGATPEEILETLPPGLGVNPGDVIQALDPAIGGISFFNGFGGTLFGPGGNSLSGSSLTSFGGISSYAGPQGPLVGVFLDNDVPNGVAPAGLDFTPGGLGTDFLALTPGLGQVFYIGDGKTSGGVFQSFTAPTGATRLFFAIPDGFGFGGAPGAYDDNDGGYRIRIGVNEAPTIPLPPAVWLLGSAFMGIVGIARRRKSRER